MDNVVVRPALSIDRTLALALAIQLLVLVNVQDFLNALAMFVYPAVDWGIYVEAGRRIMAGEAVYAAGWDYGCEPCVFRYSPVFAWLMAAIAPIGIWGWRLLQVAAVALLPRRLALLTVVLWPFWWGFASGQTVVFAFVLAVLALRGNRWAALGFLALALLVPRPLMLPVAAWLLWRDRSLWLPFAALFSIHALLVLASGYAVEWWAVLTGPNDLGSSIDYGPARIFGVAWLVVGLPLGAWLLWRGRVGLASLAVQPYWLPYYLMFALIPQQRPEHVGQVAEPVDHRRVALRGGHGRPFRVRPRPMLAGRHEHGE